MMETRLSVFDRNTGKRLCFLENSYDIGYRLEMNGLHTAVFTLPGDDEKNAYCKPLNYVELWDGAERVGLFRILPSEVRKAPETRDVIYECEHVIATLIDDVLFGFHGAGGKRMLTAQVIGYILDRQTVKRWNLRACDFSHEFEYGWENENLLSALFSVSQPFSDEYAWEFDTSDMDSWQLSLRKRDLRQKDELRYRKNLRGITKTVDPSMLTTRLYCLGYGEGDNQLTFSSLNGGRPYIDADTVGRYGVIAKIAVDRRFRYKIPLLEWGRKMLNELKEPYVSYEVEAGLALNGASAGDTVRVIDDEEGISELMLLSSVEKKNITGNVSVKYRIANRSRDVAGTIAELSDRQRIADLYAQGATNIDSRSYADNADPENPAVMRFYLPNELVRINKLILNYRLTAFRGYSKGTASGGYQASTTSVGGGDSRTSGYDGGTVVSSEDGGGDIVESAQMEARWGMSYLSTSEDGSHNHGIHSYQELAVVGAGTNTVIGSTNLVQSGEHTHAIPDHYHFVRTYPHRHEVDVPSHNHSVVIPSHEHRFNVEEHDHATLYGIYLGKAASGATLRVDGSEIPGAAQGTDIDIVKYLSMDGEGRVRRGVWHTVEIIPDAITRVEADIVSQIYVNSHGGGDY